MIPAGQATVSDEPTPIDLIARTPRAHAVADAVRTGHRSAPAGTASGCMASTRFRPTCSKNWPSLGACAGSVTSRPSARRSAPRCSKHRVSNGPSRPSNGAARSRWCSTASRDSPEVARSDGAFRRYVIRRVRGGSRAEFAARRSSGAVVGHGDEGVPAGRDGVDLAPLLSRRPRRAAVRRVQSSGAEPVQSVARCGAAAPSRSLRPTSDATLDTPGAIWAGELVRRCRRARTGSSVRAGGRDSRRRADGPRRARAALPADTRPRRGWSAWTLVADVDGEHQPGLRRLAGSSIASWRLSRRSGSCCAGSFRPS